MNVLTVPRALVGLEYKALRYPSQLLENKVVATRLPEDSGFRLAFEKLLGTVDSTVGGWLADEQLQDRGRLLTRRVDVLEKAAELETKAAERKAAADAELREQEQKATAEKDRIQAEHEQTAARLRAEKEAAKTAVAKKAEARQRADDQAITSTTQSLLSAERDRLDAQAAEVEARRKARTAAPKAQLGKAADDAEAARTARANADRLAQLAEAERASRR